MTYSCEDKIVQVNQEFFKNVYSGDLDTIDSQQVDNCAFINTTVHIVNSGTQISFIYREHTSGTHKRWEHRIVAKSVYGTYYDYYYCADSANSPYNDGGPAEFSGKVTVNSQGGGG